MVKVFYNPLANNKEGLAGAKTIESKVSEDTFEYIDLTKVDDLTQIFKSVSKEDRIVICGGDGTLNKLVNSVAEEDLPEKIDYYPCGTGNDFATELGAKREEVVEDIKKYLVSLPTVDVKGKTYKFFNGIGYGIDGYCCEVGDKLRETTTGKIDYTGIAIKGILFKFKPVTATVTVDGNTKVYKNCWLTPCMNGKCYGGGMIPTPGQERLGNPKKLSVMAYHCKSKLKALMVFPNIFKGEHVKVTKVVEILEGCNVNVKFDRACALQIDGETISDVTEFSARV
ncbi:MAG: diacylglycerol kinase family protein [Lachnospiraceae bacterium]|nr:diacylglycerol kinase family protein [Lachnospiraceae bacterium]